ncbi:6-phosphogluconolactonase [Bacillus mesophilus]|uniref:Lactonase family protein n=1 Tax=Bacillus mesophilus TaxID=1808955 RepID=A0A6M0Q6L2_9BACI|nr:lactonase family protein [Bacillus mesophilus]MBM7659899.1 6-phosphogluconolactonase [Bacillus mesophilus]NEY70758.1 lactonase family protein [Bacillus mesophilus]
MNQKVRGYIGTYTKGDSKGIYSFNLDTENATISEPSLVAELENPTYLTISDDNNYLFAVKKEGSQGGAAAYSINHQSGEVQFINSQLEEGASPCHISVNQGNNLVVTANYHKGTVDLYTVDSNNGSILSLVSSAQLEGTGPNQERQEKPHTHYSGFTPDEKYVVVVDLGIDKILTYAINNESLVEVQRFSVKPGSGPRHIEFHPNGKIAYVMTELSSEVIVLSYNGDHGQFTELQAISTIPSSFTENNQGAAIHVSSDGQFVYVSNRGHNSIAVFKINQDSGKLTFLEHTSTEGDWPRDFMLDPSERFLVLANQETHNIVLYKRDESTGKLTLTDSSLAVPYPVCVKFLKD